MEAALEGWAENTRALTKGHQRLVEESNQYRETIKDLEAKRRDLARQLAAYENSTRPSDKTASSRKIKRRSSRSPPSS